MIVNVNGSKLKKAILDRGYTLKEASELVRASDAYINVATRKGRINRLYLETLSEKLDLIPADYILPEDEPKKPTTVDSLGYDLRLSIQPDRLRLTLSHCDEEMYGAYAYIKDDSEKSLLQAISYAAHMIYKLSEQKNLGGRNNA